MGRPNPKNNPTMQRVESPAPVIVNTPPPPKFGGVPLDAKFTRKKITQPSLTSSSSTNVEQNRNVTQPVKKPTEWCGCEWWDVGCNAGCFAQEQIVDPVVSGTEWISGGVDVHVTQPITEAGEWWTQGGTDAVASTQEAIDVFGQNTQDAYNESLKFFGEATASTFEAIDVFGQNTQDAVASTQEAVDVFVKNTEDAINSTVDVVTDVVDTVGGGVIYLQDTVGGGVKWIQQQSDNAGKMFNDIAQMPSGFGTMLGNMMRGMGNIGSGSMGWIKWVLIAIGALIAGFIAWRVLK